MNDLIEPRISYLDWDSGFFKIRCGKAQLTPAVTEQELESLFSGLGEFDFVTIQNIGNDVSVNRAVAERTKAYLVDVNIQLEKNISIGVCPDSVIVPASELREQLLGQLTVEESDFCFSKFVLDPEMKKRNAYRVYEQWLGNAPKFANKYFALRMDGSTVAAYILFSILEEVATLELVKVDSSYRGQHLAADVISSVESFAAGRGCSLARVGTQLNNIPAINLYHNQKYKEISRTAIFHYWRDRA